ncbi:MAG TPA: VanZ family protein [Cerasibacillus sp.]|uniref:VanZ family protein n=1 Tax=Cerasibacillus sp. TaxID=2498711 RepID=UPI002F3E99C8
MSIHLFSVFTSLAVFLLLSSALATPWIIYQYRKHGYFNFWRSFVLVSFLFYLMTAYFLVVLPIPDVRNNCADMANTVYSQLKPFQFIHDIERETGIIWSSLASYHVLLRAPSVYQVVFNILLLLPLGVYLRYYFVKKSKWFYAVMIGFLVSLFFEITQRTALFGYFECPYRLFDVDDLIMNTLGATIGFFIAPMILFFIPSKSRIREVDIKHQSDKHATYGIQVIELFINISISKFVTGLFTTNDGPALISIIVFSLMLLLTMVVIPLFSNGFTIGGLILRVRIKQKPKLFSSLMNRYLIIVLPYLYSQLANSILQYPSEDVLVILLGILLVLSSFLIWFILFLHIIVKWYKKAARPFFNDYANIEMERVNK